MLDTHHAFVGLSTALEGFYDAVDEAIAVDDVAEIARLVSARSEVLNRLTQLHRLGHVMAPEVHAELIARETSLRHTLTAWRDATSREIATQTTRGRAVRAYAVVE